MVISYKLPGRQYHVPNMSTPYRGTSHHIGFQCLLIILTSLLFALGPSVFAQAPYPYDPTQDLSYGPYKSYGGADIDTIDLDIGTLTVKVPLISIPQRGVYFISISRF
jgi:hypothetical protein